MLIDIYVKYREDSLNGFQVIERTRFCDRQTDAWGKTICLLPSREWGRGGGGGGGLDIISYGKQIISSVFESLIYIYIYMRVNHWMG